MPYHEDAYKLEEAGKRQKLEKRGRFDRKSYAYVFAKLILVCIMNLD